jgi:hypothetical protein
MDYCFIGALVLLAGIIVYCYGFIAITVLEQKLDRDLTDIADTFKRF